MNTCAKCGQSKELCQSLEIDGVKQPRFCKECIILAMRTNNFDCSDFYWIKQLKEANDQKSLNILLKEMS